MNTKPHSLKSAITISCLTLAVSFLTSCSVMLPISATGKVGGTKTGKATATNIFGLWVDPDASIATAARNGGITHISTVDTKVTTYLYIYKTVETIVVGD